MNVSASLAQQAADVGCAALVDAMGRLYGHRAHFLPMTSPTPERAVAGRAVTMLYLPWREDMTVRAFADVLGEALEGQDTEPRVLVMSSGGYPDVSHGGGIKLARARGHVTGALVDGRLRDFDELRTYQLSTWCRGEAVRWGGDTVAPHAANVPVEFGGVSVFPGDYIYMDASGGVVIPHDRLRQVLHMARTVNSEDAESLAAIGTTATRPSALGLAPADAQ
jgi:regulator of RNase E activity RraA